MDGRRTVSLDAHRNIPPFQTVVFDTGQPIALEAVRPAAVRGLVRQLQPDALHHQQRQQLYVEKTEPPVIGKNPIHLAIRDLLDGVVRVNRKFTAGQTKIIDRAAGACRKHAAYK